MANRERPPDFMHPSLEEVLPSREDGPPTPRPMGSYPMVPQHYPPPVPYQPPYVPTYYQPPPPPPPIYPYPSRHVAAKAMILLVGSFCAGGAFGPPAMLLIWGILLIYLVYEACRRD